MPATVTLSTTTLSAAASPFDGAISVASTSGIKRGMRLFVDGESMEVLSLGVAPYVNVIRGVDGTRGAAHVSSATVYIAEAHQLYAQDPTGRPPDAIPVSPYINVKNGKVWFSRGDANTTTGSERWWQEQTATHVDGALGARSTTYDPTSST